VEGRLINTVNSALRAYPGDVEIFLAMDENDDPGYEKVNLTIYGSTKENHDPSKWEKGKKPH
jgi:hypothetical protein